MPELKFDCGARCDIRGMGDFKRMHSIHMDVCRKCNPHQTQPTYTVGFDVDIPGGTTVHVDMAFKTNTKDKKR